MAAFPSLKGHFSLGIIGFILYVCTLECMYRNMLLSRQTFPNSNNKERGVNTGFNHKLGSHPDKTRDTEQFKT
jgi:hypothetical protein